MGRENSLAMVSTGHMLKVSLSFFLSLAAFLNHSNNGIYTPLDYYI